MRMLEKSFPPTDVQVPDALRSPPKMPYPAFKAMMRVALPKIRAAMGGSPRDITTQPIDATLHSVPGYRGDVPVRAYRPADARGALPLFCFFHGGGWVGGSAAATEPFCRAVAERAACVVVNVDYHLCPEHPYPHGLEDCYAAARWAAHAPALGVDPARVAVGGDSAGGNLAAAVTLLARERGDLPLAKQVLLYPAVTLENLPSPLGGDFGAFGRLLADWYAGGAAAAAQPTVSPLNASSLAGLPQALVVVAALDGLCAQGEQYARRLAEAGVDAACVRYLNTQHAFLDRLGTQPAAEDAVNEVAAFLRADWASSQFQT